MVLTVPTTFLAFLAQSCLQIQFGILDLGNSVLIMIGVADMHVAQSLRGTVAGDQQMIPTFCLRFFNEAQKNGQAQLANNFLNPTTIVDHGINPLTCRQRRAQQMKTVEREQSKMFKVFKHCTGHYPVRQLRKRDFLQWICCFRKFSFWDCLWLQSMVAFCSSI